MGQGEPCLTLGVKHHRGEGNLGLAPRTHVLGSPQGSCLLGHRALEEARVYEKQGKIMVKSFFDRSKWKDKGLPKEKRRRSDFFWYLIRLIFLCFIYYITAKLGWVLNAGSGFPILV